MHFAEAIDDGVAIGYVNGDFAVLEPEWMAEWNQLVGLLGRHDTRDNGCREDRAFFCAYLVTIEFGDNLGRKMHDRARMRGTLRRALVADVDHRRPVTLVYVAQLAHLVFPGVLAANAVHLNFAKGMMFGNVRAPKFAVAICAL